MENSLISSIGALLLGGGALALFWKPIITRMIAIATTNEAGGDVIANYKAQVQELRQENGMLRAENNELRLENNKNLSQISSLKADMRIIKSAMSMLLAITERNSTGGDDDVRNEVRRLIGTLEGRSDDNSE